jgi:hypothetical protein
MNHKHERRDASHRHAGEIPGRIDGELTIQRGRHRERSLAAHHQRVSVGSGLRDRLGGDHAARAGAVLHHHGLAQTFGQFLRQDAGGDVGAAAGGKADKNLDGPVGIARGLRVAREHEHTRGEDETQQDAQRLPEHLLDPQRFGLSSSGTA